MERLEARYYRLWLASGADHDEWARIRLKLDMLKDLKAELRSLANSKD